MALDLTPDQIEQLKSMGVISPLQSKGDVPQRRDKGVLKRINPAIPLLSISGITVLSFGGLILFKSKAEPQKVTHLNNIPLQNSRSAIEPTQVPKSIQHYLLTSQQYFSSALQLQQTAGANQQQTIALLNQSILTATEAIKEFPSDYRGYYQRAKIYQSLSVGADPSGRPSDQFLNQTISDLSLAYKYNPNSPEITHDLASIYAKKGDAQNTLAYLTQTVSLDPTKAQNFYDLAKIQQQTGQISQAVDTYNRLIPLITDVNQKAQVEQEKESLEKLASQNPSAPNLGAPSLPNPNNTDQPLNLPDNPPTIQAMNNDNNGLIIAAPETASKVEVQNLTDSNALSGTATLSANQKDITITNSNISPESQVYLSLTKGGKNQTLKVLSKSANSFVAGFDTPLTEEVEFKWWIIQK